MSWDDEAYGPHGRNHGQADLRAATQSAMGGLFEGNVFQGRRGMGLGDNGDDPPAMSEINLTGNAVDGDLAMVLWNMGVMDASLVAPGIAPVITGLRALARRLELHPATAVSQAGRVATVDARIRARLDTAIAEVEAMDPAQRTAMMARFDSDRTRQGAPVMPAAEKEALLIRTGGETLLPPAGSSAGGAPQWLPWALLGGGALVAGGIVWAATRKPKRAVAANRRRRRRRRRTTR
jgi:hypothetical protein